MFDKLRNVAYSFLPRDQREPYLGEKLAGGPSDSPVTLVMACRLGFDARVPNANATLRLGFCRGFERAGLAYRLASVFDLARVLESSARPIVFLSGFDYFDLDAYTRRLLRGQPHFVWVPPSFRELSRVYGANGLPDPSLPGYVMRRILSSEPSFVFAIAPPSGLAYYEGWARRGMRVESLPLACDDTRYFPDSTNQRFVGTQLAFVGGFRPYKNIQYEKYLRPYEDHLRVFGYDSWPYRHFGGLIADDDERALYHSATVCPALSEPHAEIMGDIVERAFKIMGSGGLAAVDCVPFYRDLFSEAELFVPRTVTEYHEFVRSVLADPELNRTYRARGYAAIRERHTYAHRAARIVELVGLGDVVRKHAQVQVASSREVG